MQMNNLILISETDLRAVLSETIKKELESIRPVEQSNESELITRKETAKILDISLPTLNAYTRDGKIQSYRIGSRIRYKRNEVINSVLKVQSFKYR